MKSTKVKRGRPKKVREPDSIESIAEAAKNWDKGTTKKLAPPTHEVTAFLNKRFHYKDGSNCLVTYGGCKAKPIDVHYNNEK